MNHRHRNRILPEFVAMCHDDLVPMMDYIRLDVCSNLAIEMARDTHNVVYGIERLFINDLGLLRGEGLRKSTMRITKPY